MNTQSFPCRIKIFLTCTSYFLATSLPFRICSLMEIRKRQGREIKWGSQQSRGYLAKQKVWGEKGVQQNCSHHIQRLNAHHASMTKTIPIGQWTPNTTTCRRVFSGMPHQNPAKSKRMVECNKIRGDFQWLWQDTFCISITTKIRPLALLQPNRPACIPTPDPWLAHLNHRITA